MNSRSLKFPKGEYFFGDLCSLFPHPNYPTTLNKDWIDIFCANDEGDWEYKKKDYFLFNTGGDGYFLNHRSGEYVPVNSGSLGLIPTEVLDTEILENVIEDGYGIICNFSSEIKIDIQGSNYGIVGFHIYEIKNYYSFADDAIFIVIDKDQIDEEYFLERCPKFEANSQGCALFSIDDEDNSPEKLLEIIDNFGKNLFLPYLENARKKRDLGDFEGAINDFQKALSIDKSTTQEFGPDLPPIVNYTFLELGEVQVKVGKLKQAIQSFNQGIKTHPDALIYYCKRGYAKYEIGDHFKAIEDCEKALAIDKDFIHAFYTLGFINRRIGNYKEAIENYTKALNIKSSPFDKSITVQNYIALGSVNFNYGYLNANNGYIELAMEEYQKAINLEPDNKDVYFNRGSDLIILGDTKGAQKDWSKGLELGDKDVTSLLKDREQNSEIDNDNTADFYLQYGLKKLKSEDFEGAIKELTKAIEIDPNDANLYFKRSIAKSKVGDIKGANEDKNKSDEINRSYM